MILPIDRSALAEMDDSRLDVGRDLRNAYEEALNLWMQWHGAEERVFAEAYAHRDDPERTAELFAQLDEMRDRAAEVSRLLLRRR